MSRIGAAAVVFLGAAGCGGTGNTAPPAVRDSVAVGDTVRTYVVQPPGPSAGTPVPLLLLFHGTGETGRSMRRSAGLDTLAAARGYVVAYLDAAAGNWAEGCDCTRADRLGVNDTGFVREVVRKLARQYDLDDDRIFAAGFSQGGLFVHRLACELPEVVAAVASVGSGISAPMAGRCAPTRPVGVLVLQGTLDDAYPYEGAALGASSTVGARATARRWRVLNACPAGAAAGTLPDRAADGTEVLAERWGPCRSGVTVELVTVEGGTHAWAPSGDVATGTLLVDFFARQRRTPAPPR